MDYLSNNIAVNLKRIRKAKNMSLDVVAEQTGVSKSMLAQIERGEANPTVGILGKIVSGLRIEFNDLIESPRQDNYRLSIKDMIPTKEVAGRYKVYTCFPFSDSRLFEIYRIEIEPGAQYVSGSHGENTCEYITMVQGTLTLYVEEEAFVLDEDSVFRFDTDKTHIYCNQHDEKVVLYSFFVVMRC